jgi:hypothetical protein
VSSIKKYSYKKNIEISKTKASQGGRTLKNRGSDRYRMAFPGLRSISSLTLNYLLTNNSYKTYSTASQ